jgi:hypothetical protein
MLRILKYLFNLICINKVKSVAVGVLIILGVFAGRLDYDPKVSYKVIHEFKVGDTNYYVYHFNKTDLKIYSTYSKMQVDSAGCISLHRLRIIGWLGIYIRYLQLLRMFVRQNLKRYLVKRYECS